MPEMDAQAAWEHIIARHKGLVFQPPIFGHIAGGRI